jgi:hypothetical protein
MKTKALACMLAAFLAPSVFAAPKLSLTGDIAAGFSGMPSVEEAFLNLTENPNPLWGTGWEITSRRFGFGGAYMVNFSREGSSPWALDWYAEALYMSYHVFGGGAFLDPFIQAGVGCAGRVMLRDHGYCDYGYTGDLMLSLFPYVGGGLALNLEGFTIGTKVSYIPFDTPVPATWIPGYPVDPFQVSVFAGVTLGN